MTAGAATSQKNGRRVCTKGTRKVERNSHAIVPNEVLASAWSKTSPQNRAKFGISRQTFYNLRRKAGVSSTVKRGPVPTWEKVGASARNLCRACAQGRVVSSTARKWRALPRSCAQGSVTKFQQRRTQLVLLFHPKAPQRRADYVTTLLTELVVAHAFLR